jgi:aminoglycoside N3'-acetyltransferase
VVNTACVKPLDVDALVEALGPDGNLVAPTFTYSWTA